MPSPPTGIARTFASSAAESPPIVRIGTTQWTMSSTDSTPTRSNERNSRIDGAGTLRAASASFVRPPTISPIEPDWSSTTITVAD